MLLIEHYIAQSTIHGLGAFSAEFVPAGQKVWEFHSAVNALVPAVEMADLPLHAMNLIQSRAEYVEGLDSYLTSLDGDQFVNHSDNPNTEKRGAEWFASRAIHPGDEITCDYRQTLVLGFDPETGMPHSSAHLRA